MAAIAQAKTGQSAHVVTSTFEDWTLGGPVDAVLAFTSWHWIDPAVGIDKIAAAESAPSDGPGDGGTDVAD
jgi:hypothetical protein